MRAIYEDNGSGKLTGAKLQQLAAQIPADAEVIQLKVEESQKDGWFWSIKARVPEVPIPPKVNHGHPPGYRPRGDQRADRG